jgi:hypothetical protein
MNSICSIASKLIDKTPNNKIISNIIIFKES